MTDQELIQALRCCAEGECKGCAVYADKQSCQENILAQAADRLEGRIKAYGEGRIVVLPCKVGDIVWANLDGMRHTRKCVIEFANIGSHVTTIVFSTVDGLREQYGVNLSSFGKTVFLTREEAEKALKTKEG